jgi:hypothetical protein
LETEAAVEEDAELLEGEQEEGVEDVELLGEEHEEALGLGADPRPSSSHIGILASLSRAARKTFSSPRT